MEPLLLHGASFHQIYRELWAQGGMALGLLPMIVNNCCVSRTSKCWARGAYTVISYSWTITSYEGLEPGTVGLSLVTAGT